MMSTSFNSSLNSTFTKSPNRRSKNSAFQDLELYFTDVEILHSFKVYCTDTASFFFSLKKAQVDSIKQNRKSIFLRFCSYEQLKAVQKDFLPKEINISINGSCLLFESKNSKEKNWKTPLDVTTRCRAVTTRNANVFDIRLNNSRKLMAKGYGVEVVLAHKLSIFDQMSLLKTNLFIRKSSDTLKIIKSSCSGFEDIQCDAVKVPLTCCITKRIIELPLVGSKCKHVSCFEGQTFLEMHSNKPEWTCPVCYNLIRKDELLRDPLIEDILHSTQRTVEQIEFDQLGNFKRSEPEKVKPKQKKVEYVTLDDEDDNVPVNANQLQTNSLLLTPKLERLNNECDQSLQSTFNGSSRSILENLNLLSTALQTFNNSLNPNSAVTSASNNRINDDNRIIDDDVIMLSSDEETSVIMLDSELDISNHQLSESHHSDQLNDSRHPDSDQLNNSHHSNLEQFDDSNHSDSDQSSAFNFLGRKKSSNRQTIFDDSDENGNSDAERTQPDDSTDTDRTEMEEDDSDQIIRNQRRRRRVNTSTDNSNDSSDENSSDTDDSDQSTASSLVSNSSLSTNSSDSSNKNDTSSSNLLQSRGSLRRRRKKRRLYDS